MKVFVSEDYQLKMMDGNPQHKAVLKKRCIIERRFGVGRKWLGLGRARYRGKWRVAIQVLMTFLVMNLKRMVKLLLNKDKKHHR